MARFEKDFRHLCRHIDSLSGGQVRVSIKNNFNSDSDESSSASVQSFYIEITPHDGPYAHGSFIFCIKQMTEYDYAESQPFVSCLTRTYHPNIDTACRNHHDNVCVSVLDDWNREINSTLEDILQGLMFLFYSPNRDDPLTSNISTDEKQFLINVRTSIEGGFINDFDNLPFEMNYGYKRYLNQQIEKDRLIRESKYEQISIIDTPKLLINTSDSLRAQSIKYYLRNISKYLAKFYSFFFN